MFLYNSSKLSPVVFNNFKVSEGLAEILNNPILGQYLIKKCAFKPMHILRLQDVYEVEPGGIYKFSFAIANRKVKRGNHLVTQSSFITNYSFAFNEPGQNGLIGEVPFLHIIVEKPKNIFDTTPTLNFTMIFHSTRKDHFYYDGEISEDAFRLVEMTAASANYVRYTSILWINSEFSKAFHNHPRFILYPDRYGKHKVVWPNGDEINVP